jgi:hypothetical protein
LKNLQRLMPKLQLELEWKLHSVHH